MIFVVINVLFNGLILTTIFFLGSMFLGIKPSSWSFYVMGFGLAAGLTALGLTKPGQWFLRFFISGRPVVGRERQIIDPLLKDVLATVNATKGTAYATETITLLIKDTKDPNALAFGQGTIMITDGLLKTATSEELRAVLAHEVAHLYHKDSVVLIAIVFGSLATRLAMGLYAAYATVADIFSAIFGEVRGPGTVLQIMLLIPALLFLPVIILNWTGTKALQLLLMAWSRSAEYRADKFAAELGFKTGMIGFLEKIHSEFDDSFVGRILATHPAPMKRIARLGVL